MPVNYEEIAEHNAPLYPSRLPPNSLRLLQINAQASTCSFASFPLTAVPPYVCISYTWGASEPDFNYSDQPETIETGFLEVDGAKHQVSQNVLAIVGRVMSYDTVEYMWVDSLCINQADAEERNAQVSLMGEIYHSADIVAVWLGWDERGEFDTVVEICQAIRKEYLRLDAIAVASGSRIEKIANLFEPATLERLGLSFVTAEGWQAFTRFWERRWFQRAWVIQEAALAMGAPRFFWGKEELDNAMMHDVSCFFVDAEVILTSRKPGSADTQESSTNSNNARPATWFALDRRQGQILAIIRALKMLVHPEQRGGLHASFWRKCDAMGGVEKPGKGLPTRTDCMRLWTHLLELWRAFDATDARDHVYATLGTLTVLASSHGLEPPGIIVDYARSIPEVYADAARQIMTVGKNVNFLCLAQDPQTRRQTGLPSWVPDFSAGTSMPILMTTATRTQVMSNVRKLGESLSRQQSTQIRVSTDLQSLFVHALRLDEIVAVGECHDELTNDGLWEQTARILLSRKRFSEGDESRIESLGRTMVGNTSLDSESIASRDEVAEYFKSFMLTSIVTKIMRNPRHLEKMPSLKKLLDEEDDEENWEDEGEWEDEKEDEDGEGKDEEARLGRPTRIIPPLVTWTELLDVAAEGERRVRAIEAGGPIPESTPIASRAARFAIATEPMYYRRIILTRQGHLGMGPLSSQPGDLVWLMPGSPLPTILRRADGVDVVGEGCHKRFTLLGEAYLHGDPDFGAEAAGWEWIEIR